MTLLGTEPANFRLVTHFLNQMHPHVPPPPIQIVFLINLKVFFMHSKTYSFIVHSQAIILGDEVLG